MGYIEEISAVLANKQKEEINELLTELLTKAEISTLSKRWQILKMLFTGMTQRMISKELNVSLCNVTRGSKIIKNENSRILNILKEKKYNETN